VTLILTVQNAGTLPGDPMPPYEVAGDMIVVGRSRNCDWPLPDPTNAISSRHCEIRREGDAWLLKDISTNGTFLNGAETRLAEEHRIAEGDLIRIGHYEIVASMGEAKTVFAAAAPEAPASAAAPEPAPPAPAESAPPATAAAPAPAAEPEPVQDNLTMMWDSVADMNKVDWGRGGFGVKDAAPLVTDLATVEGIVQQLIDAAALGETEVRRSPELIAKAGALLKRLVAGLLVMVEARARAKAQMGAEMTGFELEGNNPIKFARSPEQALAQLLNPAQAGFMDADRAVEDAFLDLQSHQVATLKAIPGALRATLDRFSPGSIRRRRGDDLGFMAKLLPAFRDAALWRHYEREFVAVKKESDEAFMEVFAKEFRKAYERQLREGIK
jgi:type VI secretion system FHA domain protein